MFNRNKVKELELKNQLQAREIEYLQWLKIDIHNLCLTYSHP